MLSLSATEFANLIDRIDMSGTREKKKRITFLLTTIGTKSRAIGSLK